MTQTELDNVWLLWREGKTYREIKEVTGYSISRIGYIISHQITTAVGSGNWIRTAKERMEV